MPHEAPETGVDARTGTSVSVSVSVSVGAGVACALGSWALGDFRVLGGVYRVLGCRGTGILAGPGRAFAGIT
ncbi:hypothetical protein ACFFS2_04535 [Streptomyces aurantiacus]|uniref:hypothetical protein n=1 Tax=Streptomyces aurantiacus TaxID=47760 RepID=UPI001FEBB07C|nr:hypothetical protein [Streptomyces aurantiacus]